MLQVVIDHVVSSFKHLTALVALDFLVLPTDVLVEEFARAKGLIAEGTHTGRHHFVNHLVFLEGSQGAALVGALLALE